MIECLWCYVTELSGNEYVVAVRTQDGSIVPLVTETPDRLDEMREDAQRMADKNNMRLTLLKFSFRTLEDVLEPKSSTN